MKVHLNQVVAFSCDSLATEQRNKMTHPLNATSKFCNRLELFIPEERLSMFVSLKGNKYNGKKGFNGGGKRCFIVKMSS